MQLKGNWKFGLQEPATPVMEHIYNLHNFVLVIVAVIFVFVVALLFYIIFRFRDNPNSSETSHNTWLEVFWTLAPCLIVLVMAVPSFKLLYLEENPPEAEMTLKILAHQWYWSYEYPDHDGISFDSYMKQDEDLLPGEKRLLAVDNMVMVPVDTNIRVLVTSADVIHSWAVPAFGVKTDAVPGRLNETWFRVQKEGDFYGQCSELCGMLHGFMPIGVRVVSKDEFAKWTDKAKDNEDNTKQES
jgi:cytochrome c oxidase subunit 2